MSMWKEIPGSGDNKYLSLPRIGEEPLTLTIKSSEIVKRGDIKDGFWIKAYKKVEVYGEEIKVEDKKNDWKMVITTPEGKKLSINSWSPIISLKSAGVDVGMTIQIAHPEKSVWMVNILGDSKKSIAHEEEEAPSDAEENELPF